MSKTKDFTTRTYHQGKCHIRSWNHHFGDKTLSILARQFIEEIVA